MKRYVVREVSVIMPIIELPQGAIILLYKHTPKECALPGTFTEGYHRPEQWHFVYLEPLIEPVKEG